jgi:hypothetical protein
MDYNVQHLNPFVETITSIFEDINPSDVKQIHRLEPFLKAVSLTWLRFERPDLDRQRTFLNDFGISIAHHDTDNIYGHGEGPSPWFYHARKGATAKFLGMGFEVASETDLKIAAGFEGAQPTRPVEGPGGGQFVRVINPDGFEIDFVWGRTPRSQTMSAQATPFPAVRTNMPVRPTLEPSKVLGLGHVVIQCCDFEKTMDWFMKHVGLIASDAQVLEDGSIMMAFCRLNRGDTPTDHHTVAIIGGIGTLYMHSAYEVQSADAVGQGQQVLKAGGWKHAWGIGRHYYGSQIFDYWRDPYGAMMEHYTDGDKFDAHQPTRYSKFTRGSTWMWGQDMPKDFEGVGPSEIFMIVKNLWSGKIKWSRLKLVLQALKPRPRPWMK